MPVARRRDLATLAAAEAAGPRPLPVEIRGVHVTMGLASLPGKLEEYVDLERDGLTALELDVKDENGQIGFAPRSVPLASRVGAARDFYDAARRGTARARARRSTSSAASSSSRTRSSRTRGPSSRSDVATARVWEDAAGLGWTNPYDRRVWKYNVDVAAAAARAGFDEILFDYVRFPSDGDVEAAVYRNPGSIAKREAVPAFLRYAARRLEPLGVRVSAAVFGLSASARPRHRPDPTAHGAPPRPRSIAMTYPSLFGPGELGLADPSRAPGATVAPGAQALRPRASGARRARASLGPGLQLHDAVRDRAGPRADRGRAPRRARRATCSGTPRRVHGRRARRRLVARR